MQKTSRRSALGASVAVFFFAGSVAADCLKKAGSCVDGNPNVATDTDKDGLADTIYCTDRDGDGTSEMDDIRLCIDDVYAAAQAYLASGSDQQAYVKVGAGEYGCVTGANEGGTPPGTYDAAYNACLEIPSSVHLECEPGAKLVGRNPEDTGDSATPWDTVTNQNKNSTTVTDWNITIEGCYITGGMPEGDIGIATGGTASTLVDSTRSWPTNQWALPVYANHVTLRPASASTKETHTISSNTATTITIADTWTNNPAAGDVYYLTYDLQDFVDNYTWDFKSRIALHIQNAKKVKILRNTVRFTEHSGVYTSDSEDLLLQGNVVEYAGNFLADGLDGPASCVAGGPDCATYPSFYRFSRESDCVDLFDTGGPPETSGSPNGKCDSDGTTVTIPAGLGDFRKPGLVGYRLIDNIGRYSPANHENARLNEVDSPTSYMAGAFSTGNYWVQAHPAHSNTNLGGCVAVAGYGFLGDTVCDGAGGLTLGRVEDGSYTVDGYRNVCTETIEAPDCFVDQQNIVLGGENNESKEIVLRNIVTEVGEDHSTSGSQFACIGVSNYGVAKLTIDGFNLGPCGGDGISINPSQTLGNFDDPGDQLIIRNGFIHDTGIGDYNFINAGSGIEIQDIAVGMVVENVTGVNLQGPLFYASAAMTDLRLSNLNGTINGALFQGTSALASITCDGDAEGQTWLVTDAANATDCSTGSGARDNLCVCLSSSLVDANEHNGIGFATGVILTRPKLSHINITNPGDREKHAIDLAQTGVQVIDGFFDDIFMSNTIYTATLDAPNGVLDLGTDGAGDVRLGDLGCNGTLRTGFTCLESPYWDSDGTGERALVVAAPGALTDGTGDTTLLMDDSPAGECAPIGGSGTEADDTTTFKIGTTSYQYTFDSAVGAGEGLDCTITGHANAASTSVGFWFRSDTTFAAGDLEIVLDDGAVAEATENMPAYTVADTWQWIEIDVTADCAATCAGLDGFFIQTTAQAPTTFNDAVLNVDSGAVWLAECEKSLGADIRDRYPVTVVAAATAAGSANTASALTEWTDYFVNYQSGNDVICAITNQSANYAVAYVPTE